MADVVAKGGVGSLRAPCGKHTYDKVGASKWDTVHGQTHDVKGCRIEGTQGTGIRYALALAAICIAP
eukprot:323012-Prymnesium_polylepis.1